MGHLHYKGYTGTVDYEENESYLTGAVAGLRHACILYEGATLEELIQDFHNGIDNYLESCREDGIEPEKPYSGKLILRLPSALHGEAAEKAAAAGISLNEFITQAVRAYI